MEIIVLAGLCAVHTLRVKDVSVLLKVFGCPGNPSWDIETWLAKSYTWDNSGNNIQRKP